MLIGGDMPRQGLKLKQASAVLQIQPKELQNLVQFGVVKPRRLEGTYFFDASALMVAKVASYLKESLGTRTSVLSKLMEAFSHATSAPDNTDKAMNQSARRKIPLLRATF